MKIIPLTKNYFTIIDDEDFELISKNKWHVLEAQDGRRKYAADGCHRKMHRLIMNCPRHMIIDHINGNGLDNRKENLRISTQSQNSVNRKKTPGKYMRGVYRIRDRWRSIIRIKGKNHHLGYFDTEIEAHECYKKIAKETYGDWFPL